MCSTAAVLQLVQANSCAPWLQQPTKQATAYPSHVIPSNKDVALGNTHTEALLALAFCPPHTLATAALDGCIRLWSLNTGKHVGVLYRPEPNTKTPALKGKRSGDTDTGTSTRPPPCVT